MSLSQAKFRTAASRIDIDEQPIVKPFIKDTISLFKDLSFHPNGSGLAVGDIVGNINLLAIESIDHVTSEDESDEDREFRETLDQQANLKPPIHYKSAL